MKTIPVSARSRSLNALLQQAAAENLILRTSDGREFLLAELDDFEGEVSRTRRNKALMRLLDRRGRESATLTLDEVRRQLGLK